MGVDEVFMMILVIDVKRNVFEVNVRAWTWTQGQREKEGPN